MVRGGALAAAPVGHARSRCSWRSAARPGRFTFTGRDRDRPGLSGGCRRDPAVSARCAVAERRERPSRTCGRLRLPDSRPVRTWSTLPDYSDLYIQLCQIKIHYDPIPVTSRLARSAEEGIVRRLSMKMKNSSRRKVLSPTKKVWPTLVLAAGLTFPVVAASAAPVVAASAAAWHRDTAAVSTFSTASKPSEGTGPASLAGLFMPDIVAARLGGRCGAHRLGIVPAGLLRTMPRRIRGAPCRP